MNYQSIVEGGHSFNFLLVASSKSLLSQVDMLGNSDGVLAGRSDGSPLETDLSKLEHKILVPDRANEAKVKDLIKSNSNMDVFLWKDGMVDWKNTKEIDILY